MNKEELRELAALGAKRKLESVERQLASLYAEFPDIFISDGPPMLVKAEAREDGNRWNGKMQSTLEYQRRSEGAKRSWTPARRAKSAKRMKKLLKERGGFLRATDKQLATLQKKVKKATAQKGTKARGVRKDWKNKWYARLEQVGTERLAESSKALGASPASLITAGKQWLKMGVLKKTKPGYYTVGKPRPVE